jgi:archaellum biogenesis ATPase FlaH
MKLLDKLESEINDYYNQNDVIIDKFVNEIINESDFNNVNKIINFINEPAST